MDLLENNSRGITIEDVQKSAKLNKQIIEVFVDDTSTITNLEYGREDLYELLKAATKDGQTWEGFLNTTGGELELLKSVCLLIKFQWDKWGNPLVQTIKEQNLDVTKIKMTTTNEYTVLKQKKKYLKVTRNWEPTNV
jgi:hypothetical protein